MDQWLLSDKLSGKINIKLYDFNNYFKRYLYHLKFLYYVKMIKLVVEYVVSMWDFMTNLLEIYVMN